MMVLDILIMIVCVNVGLGLFVVFLLKPIRDQISSLKFIAKTIRDNQKDDSVFGDLTPEILRLVRNNTDTLDVIRDRMASMDSKKGTERDFCSDCKYGVSKIQDDTMKVICCRDIQPFARPANSPACSQGFEPKKQENDSPGG